RLISDIADEHGVYVTLAALVGSEGGKVFPGGSFIAGPKGEARGRAPLWQDAVLTASVDLADVTRARADMPLIADLETMVPHLRASLDAATAGALTPLAYDPAPAVATRETSSPSVADAPSTGGSASDFQIVRVNPSCERPPTPLEIDGVLTTEWLTHFVRYEMKRRGFSCAVVGISGGVDSAVTAYLAARALGPANVLGVRLPYRTSSAERLDHAPLGLDAAGHQTRTIRLSP